MKTVFTNGCFDILHIGHVSHLQQCKLHGDKLIVGLNSDKSVKRLKPGRPIICEAHRKMILLSLRWVDEVHIFDEDTPQALIERLKPDVIAKGVEWNGKKVAGDNIAPVVFTDVKCESTTDIINTCFWNVASEYNAHAGRGAIIEAIRAAL